MEFVFIGYNSRMETLRRCYREVNKSTLHYATSLLLDAIMMQESESLKEALLIVDLNFLALLAVRSFLFYT